MSRTTKSAAAVRILEESDPVSSDNRWMEVEGRRTEVTALETVTAPLFFEESAPVEQEPSALDRVDAFATVARPQSGDDGLGRLQALLDRAGEPVHAAAEPETVQIAGRGAVRRWRNDPHVLGRVAAVVVVLVLVATCVAVALRVLG